MDRELNCRSQSALPDAKIGHSFLIDARTRIAMMESSVPTAAPTSQMTQDPGPTTITGKTLVMTATYNEIDNLPLLVDEVFATCPHVDFLVIDDNSPDGTGQWCDKQAAADRRIHCLHRSGKLGLGTAIIAGMKYAIEHGYDYVLNMDADFSHHPRYLPAMIAGMEGRPDPEAARLARRST